MDTTYIKQVEKLSDKLNAIIQTKVDCNYNVCVSIYGLDIYDGIVETGVCGRGLTYADACKDYIAELHNLKAGEYLWHRYSKSIVIL